MAARTKFSPEEVYQRLEHHPLWVVEHSRIWRDFRFETFTQALEFVNRVAEAAKKIGHHPNIWMHEYHFLRIESYDHLTGGLSSKDVELAVAVDGLAAKMVKRSRRTSNR